MKILHVVKKYPNALGGDAVVVANLQKQQQRDGHTTVVVTSNCAEIQGQGRLYKVGLKDTPSRLDSITFKRLLSLLMLFSRMFIIVQRERPDVIHTHSIDMAFFASFAARLFGVPVVHTFHIVTFYDDNQSALRRKTEIWLAKMAKLRYVTAPNSYDVRQLQAAGLKRVLLLPNGVDTSFVVLPYNEPSDTFTFLAVGRLEHQKGYESLVKAVFLLSGNLTQPFRVIIAGEGSQSTALRSLVHNLQIDDIVSFVGRKSPQEVRALLADADAVVLPSLYETTPIALLEAWSAAVPVIVTPVGIMRDAPQGAGVAYVVPPKDEKALMRAMYFYMTHAEERLAIATKGYQEAAKYSWPLVAKTAETIYRKVQ